jgi:MFS family permease
VPEPASTPASASTSGTASAGANEQEQPAGADVAARLASPAARLLALLTTCLPAFLVLLDVPVGRPAMWSVRVALGLDRDTGNALVYAYTGPFCLLMLLRALAGRRVRSRWLFGVGLGAFALGSVACAVWPGSGGGQIAGRLVQGAGAALIVPYSLELAAGAVPERLRRTAVGLWAASLVAGFLLSDRLATSIMGQLNWRWLFLLNFPVCAVALALLPYVLGRRTGPARPPGSRGLARSGLGTAGIAGGTATISLGAPAASGPYWIGLTLVLAGAVLLTLAIRDRSPLPPQP